MRPKTLALWLSAGVPFIAYMLTASGFAYWLDSGEFVAAAVNLDIAHPPGHPLSGLYGRAFCMLPLGSLTFRVALGQACATALASCCMCRATAAALRGMQLTPAVQWSLALCGAWFGAAAYGVWFQAVRPEVYALQSLCSALIVERLLTRSAADDASAGRALTGAAFVLGLALANHHLIALLLVPAFAPALSRCVRERRWRAIASAFALGTLGLSVYLYLPLRAAAHPPANLGDPSSLERFVWVVSARVYAHDMGPDVLQPISTRGIDVLSLFFEDFHALPLLVALIGLYLLLRIAATRSAAVVIGLVLFVNAGARAWLGPVRANPDILGYLGPSYWAIGSLIACCAGAVLWLCEHEWPAAMQWFRPLALLTPALALVLVPTTWSRASLADFSATDSFDELRIRRLPPRAVVATSSPQTVFRALEIEAVEDVRPDVHHIPLPFLRYPGFADALLQRDAALTPLVQSYLAAHDHLQRASLLALSRQRPLFVELDTRVSPELYPFLRPRGLFVEASAVPERVSREVLRRALDTPEMFLLACLGSQRREAETARQLLWVHYMNAIHLGALGVRELAQREAQAALAVQPAETRVRALVRALEAPGPLEPSVFLRFP